MPRINNIQDFVNSVTKQAYGETAVTATDLTGLISLGNTVLSSTDSVDKYTGALVDRIGKTIISNRKYNSPENGILMDAFSFGAIMQKIYVAPLDAVKNKLKGLMNRSSGEIQKKKADFTADKDEREKQKRKTKDPWEV